MKVRITSIVEGMEFQGLESQSYLDLESGEVILIADEEIRAAEYDDEASNQADWFKEAIAQAKEFLENQNRYIALPSKDDLDEYRIMENFVHSIPIEEQRDEMFSLIRGKGAFSRFRQGTERFMLKEKWYKFRDLEITRFAVEWCQVNDIEYENDTGNHT
jgi:hypothetical protein